MLRDALKPSGCNVVQQYGKGVTLAPQQQNVAQRSMRHPRDMCVSLSLSIYIYIYMCISLSLCIYIYIYIYIHTHILCYALAAPPARRAVRRGDVRIFNVHIHVCTYIYIYIYMYIYIHIHTHIYIYIYKYLYFDVCTYGCTYIVYIHTYNTIARARSAATYIL